MNLFSRSIKKSQSEQQLVSRDNLPEHLHDLIVQASSVAEVEDGLETFGISKGTLLAAADIEIPAHADEIWNSAESEWREVQRLLDHPAPLRTLDAYGPNPRNIVQSILLLVAVGILITGLIARPGFPSVAMICLSIIIGCWPAFSVARNIYRAERLRRRYRQQLRSAIEAHYSTLVDRGTLPHIRVILNNLQRDQYYSNNFAVKGAPGLQSDDLRFHVKTTGSQNFIRLLGAMADRGGSVGIAGPRGSGKTSILQAICSGRLPIRSSSSQKPFGLFTVLVAAPVEFSSREFLLHLYAKICKTVISLGTEQQPPASRHSTPVPRRQVKVGAGLVGALSVIAGIVLLFFALPNGRRLRFYRKEVEPALAKLFGRNWTGVRYFADGVNLRTTLIGIGVLLAGVILCVLACARMIRIQNARYLENNLPALVIYARDQLERIQFQLSYSSGWSGTLKLPLVEGGISEMQSAAVNQMTLPDIVMDIKGFLTRISKTNSSIRLVLAIDELDKLESDIKAWQFLNDLKGIFGVSGCLYLVSISEEALSSFELRGFPFRDAFDSAFDEVAHLRQLTYSESRSLLRRRVIGLSGPYICLCHCMAGGLPRDLIRTARDLVIVRREAREDSTDLSKITIDLVQEDLQVRAAATMIAVSRKGGGLQIGDLVTWIDEVQNTRNMTAGNILDACRSYPGIATPAATGAEAGNGAELLTDASREVHRLGAGLCGLLYFSATLIELFQDSLTAAQIHLLESDSPQSINQLAVARQAFATNSVFAWNKISDFRKNWQFVVIEPAPDSGHLYFPPPPGS